MWNSWSFKEKKWHQFCLISLRYKFHGENDLVQPYCVGGAGGHGRDAVLFTTGEMAKNKSCTLSVQLSGRNYPHSSQFFLHNLEFDLFFLSLPHLFLPCLFVYLSLLKGYAETDLQRTLSLGRWAARVDGQSCQLTRQGSRGSRSQTLRSGPPTQPSCPQATPPTLTLSPF